MPATMIRTIWTRVAESRIVALYLVAAIAYEAAS